MLKQLPTTHQLLLSEHKCIQQNHAHSSFFRESLTFTVFQTCQTQCGENTQTETFNSKKLYDLPGHSVYTFKLLSFQGANSNSWATVIFLSIHCTHKNLTQKVLFKQKRTLVNKKTDASQQKCMTCNTCLWTFTRYTRVLKLTPDVIILNNQKIVT